MLETTLHIRTDADMTEMKKLNLALKVLHSLGVSKHAAGGEGRVQPLMYSDAHMCLTRFAYPFFLQIHMKMLPFMHMGTAIRASTACSNINPTSLPSCCCWWSLPLCNVLCALSSNECLHA